MASTVTPCGRPVASCSTVLASASSASASASSCGPPSLLRTGFSGTRLRLAADIRPCCTPFSFEVFAISSNDFRPGTNIELDNAPWRVQEFLHVKPGKGAAFVRTKLRNYITGNTVEKTFRAGESIDEANVIKEFKQFTYVDGDQYVFMDMTSYEEARLSDSDLADKTKFLKEGMECAVLSWNGRVIDVELPITVKLTVTQTDPGLKGDTAQGGSKPATVDTGAVVTVPLFVNTGDVIMVDTRTGSYMSRA